MQFPVQDYPIGTRFKVIDPNSDDAGKVFTRVEGGIQEEGYDSLRGFNGWEPCEVIP